MKNIKSIFAHTFNTNCLNCENTKCHFNPQIKVINSNYFYQKQFNDNTSEILTFLNGCCDTYINGVILAMFGSWDQALAYIISTIPDPDTERFGFIDGYE
jgi:hypothetical protein